MNPSKKEAQEALNELKVVRYETEEELGDLYVENIKPKPFQTIQAVIDQMPDDEVKECKRINDGDCSSCGYWIDNNYCECSDEYMFCPMCGAKIIDDLEVD